VAELVLTEGETIGSGVKVTVKVRDLVAPLVSLNVTVHVHRLVCVLSTLDSTLACNVMAVSELTVTREFQLVSPLFQV